MKKGFFYVNNLKNVRTFQSIKKMYKYMDFAPMVYDYFIDEYVRFLCFTFEL